MSERERSLHHFHTAADNGDQRGQDHPDRPPIAGRVARFLLTARVFQIQTRRQRLRARQRQPPQTRRRKRQQRHIGRHHGQQQNERPDRREPAHDQRNGGQGRHDGNAAMQQQTGAVLFDLPDQHRAQAEQTGQIEQIGAKHQSVSDICAPRTPAP